MRDCRSCAVRPAVMSCLFRVYCLTWDINVLNALLVLAPDVI